MNPTKKATASTFVTVLFERADHHLLIANFYTQYVDREMHIRFDVGTMRCDAMRWRGKLDPSGRSGALFGLPFPGLSLSWHHSSCCINLVGDARLWVYNSSAEQFRFRRFSGSALSPPKDGGPRRHAAKGVSRRGEEFGRMIVLRYIDLFLVPRCNKMKIDVSDKRGWHSGHQRRRQGVFPLFIFLFSSCLSYHLCFLVLVFSDLN